MDRRVHRHARWPVVVQADDRCLVKVKRFSRENRERGSWFRFGTVIDTRLADLSLNQTKFDKEIHDLVHAWGSTGSIHRIVVARDKTPRPNAMAGDHYSIVIEARDDPPRGSYINRRIPSQVDRSAPVTYPDVTFTF